MHIDFSRVESVLVNDAPNEVTLESFAKACGYGSRQALYNIKVRCEAGRPMSYATAQRILRGLRTLTGRNVSLNEIQQEKAT